MRERVCGLISFVHHGAPGSRIGTVHAYGQPAIKCLFWLGDPRASGAWVDVGKYQYLLVGDGVDDAYCEVVVVLDAVGTLPGYSMRHSVPGSWERRCHVWDKLFPDPLLHRARFASPRGAHDSRRRLEVHRPRNALDSEHLMSGLSTIPTYVGPFGSVVLVQD